MSDHLPSELQSEIMKMLPVQSLFRFRSVCKSWKSVIDSSDFITGYSGQHHHLFVGYTDDKDMFNYKQSFVSIVDDNNINSPKQRVSVTLPGFQYIIGSSHGLLCVYSPNRVLIFNPCIRRKAVAVDLSRVEYGWSIITVLGFGVCRETNDPKIVKITPTISLWQVEVFTLSTGAWRSPYSDDFSCKSVKFSCDQVVIDGCLYWLARDRLVDEYYNLIVSFDLTSEEFREVNLPDSLAGYGSFSMYKLSDSLAVVKESIDAHKLGFDVWRMEDDSFKKLYTISSHSPDVSILRVCGLRKTGEPLLEVILRAQHGYTRMLAAYESYSKSITNLGIIGRNIYVYNYMETLLLL